MYGSLKNVWLLFSESFAFVTGIFYDLSLVLVCNKPVLLDNIYNSILNPLENVMIGSKKHPVFMFVKFAVDTIMQEKDHYEWCIAHNFLNDILIELQ